MATEAGSADVLVVGAGAAGCTLAYLLARAGRDVLVVERTVVVGVDEEAHVATCKDLDAGEEFQVEYGTLVAADGANSTLRRMITGQRPRAAVSFITETAPPADGSTLVQRVYPGVAGGCWQVPVYAIILATSFAAYGAVKKWGGYPSVEGMAVESTMTGAAGLIAMAIGCLIPGLWENLTPVTAASPLAWTEGGPVLVLLFALGGFFTWLPLQLFSEAANRIPLSWVGFCQYLSPTLALIIGVAMFGEPFTTSHAVLFACLWAGIALIALEAFMRSRKERAKQ